MKSNFDINEAEMLHESSVMFKSILCGLVLREFLVLKVGRCQKSKQVSRNK
jgi:hypothetical protein